MKFQHGLLDDAKQAEPRPKPEERPVIGGDVEKNRLFETLDEETTSERGYLKLLAMIIVPILIAGGVIFYLTLPGYGDQVRAPRGMEMAIRDHMLTKQKRTATDVSVYYCGGTYWARVGVESRTDVPENPLAGIKTYTAHIRSAGTDVWHVEAAPVTNSAADKPCTPSFAVNDQR